ncbi:MAG: LPXTG cell wall anchor domain-containing protein [Propionibacteriales bacterium]|nr:LPXTG cell wall anchor domain-containing protein [Propionibacteriales bacterium]
MLRKTIALAALGAALVVAPATSAVADPYTPKIPTETVIEVTSTGPGDPITIVVSSSANYPTPPEGDIAVTISKSSGTARSARSVVAAPLFTTTVHFVDEPITIEGPGLPKGSYIGTAELTPDDTGLFLPSDDTDLFRVGADGETGGEEDDGGLPNTGGPNFMWLILGTGLVGAGAGGVTYSRRRQDAAA